MRTSINIRGVLAVAAVTAGASLVGMSGAVAAAGPCQDSPLTSLDAPYACDGPAGLAVPQGRPGSGDLLIGIEHIGRSSGLMSGTTAVIGLTDLPAIVRSTGLPGFLRGEFVYHVTRGVVGYDRRLATGGAAVSDEPHSGLPIDPLTVLGAAPSVVPAHEAPGAPSVGDAAYQSRSVDKASSGDDVVSTEVERIPSVDTALTDLHVH
jgi:hypothetical protein